MDTASIIKLCIEAPVAILIFVLLIVFMHEIDKDKKRQEESSKVEDGRRKEEDDKFKVILETIALIKEKQENTPVKCHTKEEEDSMSKLNSFIQQQIDTLRSVTGANRIGFYFFHNGGYTTTGIPFAKMSLSAESLDEFSKPVMPLYQNMPRAIYPGIIENLRQDGNYWIDNINDIKGADNSTYSIYKSRGTKVAYIQGVKDNLFDVYLGFISVEYSTNEPPKETKSIQVEISKTSQRIAGAMQLYNDKGRDRKCPVVPSKDKEGGE